MTREEAKRIARLFKSRFHDWVMQNTGIVPEHLTDGAVECLMDELLGPRELEWEYRYKSDSDNTDLWVAGDYEIHVEGCRGTFCVRHKKCGVSGNNYTLAEAKAAANEHWMKSDQ